MDSASSTTRTDQVPGSARPSRGFRSLCRALRWASLSSRLVRTADDLPDHLRADIDLEPMGRAQSLALAPHKWPCVPIECGCVPIRDASLQHDTFSLQADYLRGTGRAAARECAGPFEFGLQLTRGPRAVKTAAVLMRLGRRGVAETISRHLELAAWLAERIEAAPDLELTARGPLSIVCFRALADSHQREDEKTDRLNSRIAARLSARGRVFLTPTVIRGQTSLRASIIHYDVQQHDLQILLDEVRAATADVLAEEVIPQMQEKEPLA